MAGAYLNAERHQLKICSMMRTAQSCAQLALKFPSASNYKMRAGCDGQVYLSPGGLHAWPIICLLDPFLCVDAAAWEEPHQHDFRFTARVVVHVRYHGHDGGCQFRHGLSHRRPFLRARVRGVCLVHRNSSKA